jgi:hypothetical protein
LHCQLHPGFSLSPETAARSADTPSCQTWTNLILHVALLPLIPVTITKIIIL